MICGCCGKEIEPWEPVRILSSVSTSYGYIVQLDLCVHCSAAYNAIKEKRQQGQGQTKQQEANLAGQKQHEGTWKK